METIIIQIGNSDNKLSQGDWAHFVAEVDRLIGSVAFETHFRGGSSFDEPWQNACWVIVSNHFNDCLVALSNIGKKYRQDSIAIVRGEAEFI